VRIDHRGALDLDAFALGIDQEQASCPRARPLRPRCAPPRSEGPLWWPSPPGLVAHKLDRSPKHTAAFLVSACDVLPFVDAREASKEPSASQANARIFARQLRRATTRSREHRCGKNATSSVAPISSITTAGSPSPKPLPPKASASRPEKPLGERPPACRGKIPLLRCCLAIAADARPAPCR